MLDSFSSSVMQYVMQIIDTEVNIIYTFGHAAVQLAEALYYKPEGRVFDAN
jgi:hypothetical protein